ncbi:MAG: hypothetical protein MR210_05165 [Erysipelotrichaceae bacterium]|nr:hypothetical protein [Erysipelotrichaceae bacterium]MDY5252105.1 hypothetical protein [Erysipelotrichaceae bacterium]
MSLFTQLMSPSLNEDYQYQIIAIDGNCASGKTTLAKQIQSHYPNSAILHIDDFFLPKNQRKATWLEDIAGNIDLRTIKDLLNQYQKDHFIAYQPFDCHQQAYKEGITIDHPSFLIVEGSYAFHPSLIDAYDLKIFLTCNENKQLLRLGLRQDDLQSFKDIWIKKEQTYFTTYSIKEKADLIFDTSALF